VRTTYHHNARGGHCPGHIRDAFLNALEAYAAWNDGEPEPLVELEVNYEPTLIPISKACGLVWNCSDILPSDARDTLEDVGLDVKRWTYAAAARAMLVRI
jgi:hypothetical protein